MKKMVAINILQGLAGPGSEQLDLPVGVPAFCNGVGIDGP